MPFKYSDAWMDEPATQQLKGGKTWAVEKPFWWLGKNRTILVPPSGRGDIATWIESPEWITDYGSIPAIFQSLFSKTEYGGPYLLHDWLYSAELFDRATCDWILLEALQEAGANWFTRNAIYSAVRAGGWNVWRKHDKNKVKELKDYAASF